MTNPYDQFDSPANVYDQFDTGVAEDVAKSIGIAIPKTAIGLAGAGGDIRELSDAIGNRLATKFSTPTTADLITKDAGAQQPSKIGMAIEPILQAFMPPTGAGASKLATGSNAAPTSQQLRQTVEGVTGPLYESKTMPGEYAQTGTGFLLNLLGGGRGGIGKRFVTDVVAPAVTSETAGQLTKGTAAEPVARLIGAVGGNAAASKAAGALERSSVRAQAPSHEGVRQEAQDAYRDIKDLSNTSSSAVVPGGTPVTMSARSADQLAENIQRNLKADGFRPVTAGRTQALVEELRQPLKTDKPRLDPTTSEKIAVPQDVLAVRTALGKVRMGTDPAERAAAADAIDKIDTYLSNLRNPRSAVSGPGHLVADAADRAIGNYAVAKRSERITDAVKKAEDQAASSGIGGNLDNALRQQLKAILKSPKQSAGYSPEELAAMRAAVRGTMTSNLARAVSRLGPSHLLSGGLAAAGAYGATGDPWAAVGAMAAGAAGQKYATASRQRQIANLDALVRSRSSLSPVSPQQMALALRNPVQWRQALIPALMSQQQMPTTLSLVDKR